MLLNLGGWKAHGKNVQTHLAIVARAKDLSKSPAAEREKGTSMVVGKGANCRAGTLW